MYNFSSNNYGKPVKASTTAVRLLLKKFPHLSTLEWSKISVYITMQDLKYRCIYRLINVPKLHIEFTCKCKCVKAGQV